ncbi:MAG: [protein-PII] uridylyltransferase [Candidatus Methylophosphatis roskildensis]
MKKPATRAATSPATESRPGLHACLKTRLQDGMGALRDAYAAKANPKRLLSGRCRLVDGVLADLWRATSLPDELAFAAVGGYGRGELYPASDVDLLILLPESITPETERRLEDLVGTFWDIGLDIGHSVRTLAECLAESARDITIQTSLLEARLIGGDHTAFSRLCLAMHAQLDLKTYFNAKHLEQDQRYTRYEQTPYSLEPNCKESPGGLRDLQVIGWIAQAAGIGAEWRGLAYAQLLTEAEAAQARHAERFLRQVRIGLHLLTGRREDRLLFDYQESLARELGLAASPTKRASEVLMQRYYQNAKLVTQLNTIILQNLAATIFPTPGKPAVYSINPHFQMTRELLDVTSEDLFKREPRAILESFLLMQQRSELKGMTARTLRALWRARRLIGPTFRADPANRAMFLQMFKQKRGLVQEFRRMNQLGILGAYLPSFGRIVGQMQHDLFHVYTVDQHIIQVLRNVRRFTVAEHAHEYPLLARLIIGFEQHWLIYLAALFHDIAKGRGGDHSKLGRKDAQDFCREHGLTADDTALVGWLVEHHLTMSSVAQKQDLADSEVIGNFAALVQDERRLTALYILTHADIRGTSPKVWNAWKGKLLEDLYFATRRLLRGATPHQALGVEQRQESTRRLIRYYGLMAGVEDKLWDELDTVYFMRHDAEEVAWHTRMLYYRSHGAQPVVRARPNPFGEGLQVMVYAPDQRDLFMRLCGFFARIGFSIVDAKIHTTRHGYALDSFILLDPRGEQNYRDVVGLLEHDLEDHLRQIAPAETPIRGRLSRQARHFPITPEVLIRPDERGQLYLMFVSAADRPGLLYSVARVLANHRINLHTAKIATLGDRVEDTFLISGAVLARNNSVIRIEQEVLKELQVPA